MRRPDIHTSGGQLNTKRMRPFTLMVWGTFALAARCINAGGVVGETKKGLLFAEDLVLSAEAGNSHGVTAALGAGVAVDSEHRGDTALRRAAMLGYADIVSILLQADADPNLKDIDGRSALFYASQKNHVEILGQLLDAGAEPNIQENVNGDSPLHAAVFFQSKECVQMLLENFADYNSRNNLGETPVYISVKAGNENVARMLVQAGADLDIQTTERGWTALILAVAMKRNNFVELLTNDRATQICEIIVVGPHSVNVLS